LHHATLGSLLVAVNSNTASAKRSQPMQALGAQALA